MQPQKTINSEQLSMHTPAMVFFRYLKSLDSYWPLFPSVIAAFLVLSGQAYYGFVNHDNFDWLIRPGEVQGYGTPWQKTLWEGRWINYLWSLFSYNLTPAFSSLLFIFAYCLSCWLLTRVVIQPRASVLAALALFFSPIGADISLWPTTFVSAVVILCVGLALFCLNRGFLSKKHVQLLLVVQYIFCHL